MEWRTICPSQRGKRTYIGRDYRIDKQCLMLALTCCKWYNCWHNNVSNVCWFYATFKIIHLLKRIAINLTRIKVQVCLFFDLPSKFSSKQTHMSKAPSFYQPDTCFLPFPLTLFLFLHFASLHFCPVARHHVVWMLSALHLL